MTSVSHVNRSKQNAVAICTTKEKEDNQVECCQLEDEQERAESTEPMNKVSWRKQSGCET